MNRAVIYYSLTGNTRAAAEKIAEKLGADCFGITTVKPMPESRNQQIMYGGMLATFGIKPAIEAMPDVSGYDEIIIGTPVWAGKRAAATATLLKDKQLAGKIVGAVVLSGSGNAEKCCEAFRKDLKKLKYTVSLVDSYNALSKDNDDKIEEFVKYFL